MYSTEQKLQFAEEKNAIYRGFLDKMTPSDISEEVRQTLVSLKKQGIKLAVGSSSKNTPLILEKTNSAQYFDAVSDGNNITRSKPDPEVFLKAADFLGLEPCDCLVVEDAFSGIDAGKAGGFRTAGIGPASGYKKTDYRIKTFSDLLKIAI